MSTLTSNDVYGLMEAYQAVYAPQELTEEQVWEEVEIWVNDLLEEGYDLSEYTWEEMYEAYIVERGAPTDPKAKAAYDANVAKNRQNLGKAILSPFTVRGGPGSGARRGAAPTPQAPSIRSGKYATPSQQVRFSTPTPPTPSPARTPAPAGRTPGVTPAPITRTPSPAGRTPGVTPAPATRPAAVPAKPAGTAPAPKPPATTTPSAPAKPSLLSQVDDLKKMRTKSLLRQGKPLSAATVAASTTPAFQANSFDLFDVVIGHLLDEGYADTEEAALVIMSNMSEEWRESIIEGNQRNPEKDERTPKSDEAIPGQAPRKMPRRGHPDREAFEKWYAKNVR